LRRESPYVTIVPTYKQYVRYSSSKAFHSLVHICGDHVFSYWKFGLGPRFLTEGLLCHPQLLHWPELDVSTRLHSSWSLVILTNMHFSFFL
jgi:hypothetical protein